RFIDEAVEYDFRSRRIVADREIERPLRPDGAELARTFQGGILRGLEFLSGHERNHIGRKTVTRKKSSVRKATEQEFSAHAPKLDRHPGLARVLEAFILREGDQPLPFRDKALREFGDGALCVL